MADSSFIICTKDRPKDIIECISTVLRQTVLPKELIIIDASSNEETCDVVRRLLAGSNIKLIYRHSKPNTSYQRNIGIEVASGSIIFFFDDDVLIDDDYHQKILETYSTDSNERVAGVTGLIKNPIENPFLGKIFRRLFLLDGEERSNAKSSAHVLNNAKVRTVSNMWGCQMSFKKKVFDKYRFDESMGELSGYAFLEDLEFTSRVAQEYILLQNLSTGVYHKVSPVARDKTEKLEEATVLNKYYIFKKNTPKSLINCLVFAWQQIGIIIHAFAQTVRKRDMGWTIGVLKGHWRLLFYRK